jgi:hypothetical protein
MVRARDPQVLRLKCHRAFERPPAAGMRRKSQVYKDLPPALSSRTRASFCAGDSSRRYVPALDPGAVLGALKTWQWPCET